MSIALGPTRPDERHERIFLRRRTRRSLLLVILILAAAGGGAVAIHRLSAPAPAAGGVPLIRADGQPTRKRPDNPGGMPIIGQGTLALDEGKGQPKVEHLLPEPETPLPPPAPVEPAVSAPPAAAIAPEPTPPAAAAPAAPAEAAQPAPPPIAVQPAAPPAAAQPMSLPKPVAHAPPPTARTAAAKGYRLQLGAVRDPEAAKREWERIKRRHADLLGGLTYATERVDLGARGVFYRIEAGPFADPARAERDCRELKHRGVSCLLVKP